MTYKSFPVQTGMGEHGEIIQLTPARLRPQKSFQLITVTDNHINVIPVDTCTTQHTQNHPVNTYLARTPKHSVDYPCADHINIIQLTLARLKTPKSFQLITGAEIT